MKIGPKIEQRRLKLNLTQRELAKLIGVTAAAISLWETGRLNPRKDRLPKIAEALGYPVRTLINSLFEES